LYRLHRIIVLAALLLFLAGCDNPSTRPAADSRPNFLIIVSDDQRYDHMEYMPLTRALIFDQGVTFDHAYATTPQCCPSRSSILTGMYAHNHGVLTNAMKLEQTTLPQRLQEAGYTTGLVGKYLNSYPVKRDPPLPEFDTWVSFDSGPDHALYFDPEFYIGATKSEQEGYQTYLLRDYALEFLDEAAKRDKPFFLLFTPYAPHSPSIPAPEDTNLYSDLPPAHSPNINEEDVSDKPAWLQEKPLLTEEEIAKFDSNYRNQIRTLAALDRSIEALIQKLEDEGMLENTVIIFMSDNGHGRGEHRLPGGKVYPYEEMIHVPMAMRYTPLIDDPYIESAIVANIDIAPTLYALAGIPIPTDVDGASLVSLLQGDEDWRDKILIEAWPKPGQDSPPYLAVRTARYLYVETRGDRSELYDMESDPFQLENQIDNLKYADIVAELHAYLEEARGSIPPVTPYYDAKDDE
jgi:N-acetylglucosamine-6-sulfatase